MTTPIPEYLDLLLPRVGAERLVKAGFTKDHADTWRWFLGMAVAPERSVPKERTEAARLCLDMIAVEWLGSHWGYGLHLQIDGPEANVTEYDGQAFGTGDTSHVAIVAALRTEEV